MRLIKHAPPRPTDLPTLILRGLVLDLKPRPSSSAMLKSIEALATRPGLRLTTRHLTADAMERAARRLSAARRPANSIRSVLAHVHQLWTYAHRLGLTDVPPDELPAQAGRSSAHRPPDPTRQQIAARAAELHAGWTEEERRKKLGAAAR